MGAYGVLLIIVLIVVSGGIAYIGDAVGRRMGRKRLTLFGLRPRYTAIVISVLAGMIIAGWTLASAMLVSENVRIGLTRVEELVGQNRKLAGQEKALRRQVRTQAQELTRTQQKSRELTAQTKALSARIDTQRQTLTKLNADLAARQKKLAQVEAAAGRIGALVIKNYQDIATLRSERQRLEGNIRDLLGWRQQALETFGEVRTAPVTFEANEEIATAVLEKGLARAAVIARLHQLLAAANRLAVQRGARPAEGRQAIIILKNVLEEKSGLPVPYSEQAVLSALADAVAEAPSGVVVRLVSLSNAVKGEQVIADFQLFNNRLIYRKGEVLAESTVDASLPQGRLFAELVYLVRDRVGSRARSDGVMPTARRLAPDGSLIPQQGVGEISTEALFDLVGKIKQAGGQVRVAATAAEEAWTSGPVSLALDTHAP